MNDVPDNQIAEDNSDSLAEVEVVESDLAVEPQLTGWRAVYDFVMQSYCWTVIFFGIYVLSVGPFYTSWRQAVERGRSPLLQLLYLPLASLCSKSETLNTVVEWYVGLWQA
ncbi:MAG: hypothetical protein AB8G99_08240 [Planctomycetaceae bacterium]